MPIAFPCTVIQLLIIAAPGSSSVNSGSIRAHTCRQREIAAEQRQHPAGRFRNREGTARQDGPRAVVIEIVNVEIPITELDHKLHARLGVFLPKTREERIDDPIGVGVQSSDVPERFNAGSDAIVQVEILGGSEYNPAGGGGGGYDVVSSQGVNYPGGSGGSGVVAFQVVYDVVTPDSMWIDGCNDSGADSMELAVKPAFGSRPVDISQWIDYTLEHGCLTCYSSTNEQDLTADPIAPEFEVTPLGFRGDADRSCIWMKLDLTGCATGSPVRYWKPVFVNDQAVP